MKIRFSTLLLVTGLVLTGCSSSEEAEETDETGETTEEQALTIGGGTSPGGGLSNWCKERADCVDNCHRDYSSPIMRSTCVKRFCPTCPAKAGAVMQ